MESIIILCGCVILVGLTEAWSMGSKCGLTCTPKHPQEQYCKADFVIRGQVQSRNYTIREGMPDQGNEMEADMPYNYQIVYTVEIEKVYKGASYFSEGMDVYIKTEADNNMCGVGNLMNRKSYLISGQKEDDFMLNVNGCNWVTEFKKLTPAQKSGVKRQYGANCNACQIESCNNTRCKPTSKSRCAYDSTRTESCHERYSYCITKKNGVCKWDKRRDEMKACLTTNTK